MIPGVFFVCAAREAFGPPTSKLPIVLGIVFVTMVEGAREPISLYLDFRVRVYKMGIKRKI